LSLVLFQGLCQYPETERVKPGQWGVGVAEALGKELLNSLKQNTGGSVWESNPPKTLLVPPNGVEVREAHRDLYAPSRYHLSIY